MRTKKISIIGLLFLGLAGLDSCDSHGIKKGEMILVQADSVKKIVLRTEEKNISGLNLSRPEIGLHELTCKRDEKIR